MPLAFNGGSALYAVPDLSGDGSVPVLANSTNTPVDGVMFTEGLDVYPVPSVTTLMLVTCPLATVAMAVAPLPPPPLTTT